MILVQFMDTNSNFWSSKFFKEATSDVIDFINEKEEAGCIVRVFKKIDIYKELAK